MKQIQLAKDKGAEEARQDLAAGNPKQYRSSWILGRSYDWDPVTGLRIVDTGCCIDPCDPFHDGEYNRVVAEWIAEHGLPPGSRKPRFVTPAFAQKALRSGMSLGRGDQVVGAPGKVMRWRKPNTHDWDQLLAESNGKMIWSVWVGGAHLIRVAWSGRSSWFVEFSPGLRGEHGSVWHVDADGDGVLQTFEMTEQR